MNCKISKAIFQMIMSFLSDRKAIFISIVVALTNIVAKELI
jgi:hypothetical protein